MTTATVLSCDFCQREHHVGEVGGKDGLQALEERIKGKECVKCQGGLRVVHLPRHGGKFGEFAPACNCEDIFGPVTVKSPHPINRRYGQMVERAIATQPGRPALTINEIRKFISPLADEIEAHVFLRYCQGNRLDPFINEAYLIKYDKNKPAAIVIGMSALLKRAASNEHYRGYSAGVIIEDAAGEVVNREGEIVGSRETLIGGWAEFRRDDWDQPLKVSVNLSEYDLKQALWSSHKATMITKTAISQGARRGFPGEVGGLFETETLSVEFGDVEHVSREAIGQPDINVNATTGEIIDEPSDRTACPIHGTAWAEGQHGQWHGTPQGEPACSPGKAFMAKTGLSQDEANAMLKGWFNVTQSKLSGLQLPDALTRAEPASTPEPATTAPVATGEPREEPTPTETPEGGDYVAPTSEAWAEFWATIKGEWGKDEAWAMKGCAGLPVGQFLSKHPDKKLADVLGMLEDQRSLYG